jgi:hypothetical protein
MEASKACGASWSQPLEGMISEIAACVALPMTYSFNTLAAVPPKIMLRSALVRLSCSTNSTGCRRPMSKQ